MENKLITAAANIEKNYTDKDIWPTTAKLNTEHLVKGYGADLLNLYKNIMDTSLANGSDKDQRIKSMCETFGITFFNGKFY